MTITSQPSADGRELTIVINGRFDFNAHQAFREAYLRSDVQPQRYVLDLQGANYLDSSALGMLLIVAEILFELGELAFGLIELGLPLAEHPRRLALGLLGHLDDRRHAVGPTRRHDSTPLARLAECRLQA